MLAGFNLQRLFFIQIAKFLDLRMAEQRVVVEVQLGVERVELAILCQQERIDFCQRGIGALEGLVKLHHEAAGGIDQSDGRPRPNASFRA